MKPTLKTIQAINDNVCKEKQRRKLCIKNNICPECGAPIIRENYELYDKPGKFLFWTIKGFSWDYRTVCSKNKSHYEHAISYDVA